MLNPNIKEEFYTVGPTNKKPLFKLRPQKVSYSKRPSHDQGQSFLYIGNQVKSRYMTDLTFMCIEHKWYILHFYHVTILLCESSILKMLILF